MRATNKLRSLEKVFKTRARNIQYSILRTAPSQLNREKRYVLAYSVIDLHNSWSNFCRSYLLSYSKSPKTRDGNRLFCLQPLNENEIIGLTIRNFKPYATPKSDGSWHRRDEPPWHDPNILLKGCELIAASNLLDVQAAFSSNSRVFLDLPVYRNFFAHSNKQTEDAARRLASQYSIPTGLRPYDILMTRPVGRPQALLFEWVDELVFTAEFLCF